MRIRTYVAETDLEPTRQIYNHYIATSNATPERDARTPERHREIMEQSYITLVAERDGDVIGFGFIKPYRTGDPSYAPTGEVGIYLRPEAIGAGLGSRLGGRLIEHERERGALHSLLAIIDEANKKSAALIEGLGGHLVGRLPEVGYKDRKRVTICFYQFMLGSGD